MAVEHYIGLDVHCQFTEIAVVTPTGRVTKRLRCSTTLAALIEAVKSVRGQRHVVLEEGPVADWVYRGLQSCGAEVVVCRPAKQKLPREGDL